MPSLLDKTIIPAAVAIALTVLVVEPALAQQRIFRPPPETGEAWRPRPYQRGGATYDAPPGYRGIITATTPNADGNFGSASIGGSGGSR